MIESAGAGIAINPPEVVVDEAVKAFVLSSSLGAEFDMAVALARSAFAPSTYVKVTLEDDPEEEGAPPTVVFGASTALGTVAFRDAREAFYRALRAEGARRLCSYLAVVRD